MLRSSYGTPWNAQSAEGREENELHEIGETFPQSAA